MGRRLLIVALCGAVLAIAVAAVVVVAFVRRPSPTPASMSDALRRYRSSTVPERTVALDPGVLTATGSGSNELEKPLTRQQDGASMPITVESLSNDCSRWRIDYNSSHFQSLDLCASGDGVDVVAQSSGQAWDFGVVTVSNVGVFRCDPPVKIRADETSAAPAVRTCTGTNSAVAGEATVELTVEHLGTTTLDVDNTKRAVVRQRWTQKLSGHQTGTLRDEWWFDEANGLPLRAERNYELSTPTPLGDVRYVESGEWTLASLERAR